jgi:hypothetical protein
LVTINDERKRTQRGEYVHLDCYKGNVRPPGDCAYECAQDDCDDAEGDSDGDDDGGDGGGSDGN